MNPRDLNGKGFICSSEHDIWVVVERYNGTRKDDDYRYAGAPCMSYEEAVDLMGSRASFDTKLELAKYVRDDGAYYDEINSETGEVVKQYIIKKIGRM